MTRKILFIFALFSGYLFFLVLTFPAIHAYQHFRQLVPELKPNNIQGTVWNMSSSNLLIGNWLFYSSNGSFNLLPMLAGRLSMDIVLKGRGTRTSATLDFLSANELQFRNFKSSITASQISKWINQPDYISGKFQVNLDKLLLAKNQGVIRQTQGRIVWQKASAGQTNPIRLGQVVFDVKSQGKLIKATITNLKSPFSIEGQIELNENGSYSLFAKIAARNNTDTKTLSRIRSLGKTNQQGQYHFRLKGKL